MQKPLAAAVVLAIVLGLAPVPAAALDAVGVGAEDGRISLGHAMERRPETGRSLRIEGEGGAAVDATASPSNLSPGWIVFALKNDSPQPLTRWLVLENSGSADSGFFLPVLGGPR